MGRIADIIPALYYGNNNDLIRFVNALDVDVKNFEKNIRGITDLINIDKCPDDKLAYLAALTNCPLIGNDPAFWRKQLKNWPYILKFKGTARSLEIVLDSIGAQSWDIKTFFRDAGGGYTTTKPTGEPFQDKNGIWHNVRTGYFGIEITLSKDFVQNQNYSWDVNDIKEKLSFWFERGKPYHAELLNLLIIPPNFLPEDHICFWDACSWEHAELKIYDWGMLNLKPSIFEIDPVIKRDFQRRGFTITDAAFWGINQWDYVPYRFLQAGQNSETGIICSLEWGDGDNAMLFPNLWDNSKWDYVSTFSRSFGQDFTHGFSVGFDLDTDRPQIFRPANIHGFYCGTWPFWDLSTWPEHYSWGEEHEQQPVKLTTLSEISAALDWNSQRGEKYFFFDKDKWDFQEREKYNAPLPKWSNFKTWAGSDTWDTTTEQAMTWDVGTWILQGE